MGQSEGSDMTVLVTGGAGYIGSHMALALADAGRDVVVLDDLSTGFDWMVTPSATLIQGDVGDEGLVPFSARQCAMALSGFSSLRPRPFMAMPGKARLPRRRHLTRFRPTAHRSS